jgi:hypothetical protein
MFGGKAGPQHLAERRQIVGRRLAAELDDLGQERGLLLVQERCGAGGFGFGSIAGFIAESR